MIPAGVQVCVVNLDTRGARRDNVGHATFSPRERATRGFSRAGRNRAGTTGKPGRSALARGARGPKFTMRETVHVSQAVHGVRSPTFPQPMVPIKFALTAITNT